MMKLMVVKDDVHLGCIEMTDSGLVIKKYKPEFEVEVEDAPDEDDRDDAYDYDDMSGAIVTGKQIGRAHV